MSNYVMQFKGYEFGGQRRDPSKTSVFRDMSSRSSARLSDEVTDSNLFEEIEVKDDSLVGNGGMPFNSTSTPKVQYQNQDNHSTGRPFLGSAKNMVGHSRTGSFLGGNSLKQSPPPTSFLYEQESGLGSLVTSASWSSSSYCDSRLHSMTQCQFSDKSSYDLANRSKILENLPFPTSHQKGSRTRTTSVSSVNDVFPPKERSPLQSSLSKLHGRRRVTSVFHVDYPSYLECQRETRRSNSFSYHYPSFDLDARSHSRGSSQSPTYRQADPKLRSVSSEGGSPTLGHAILMGCTRSNSSPDRDNGSSPDYDLAELVKVLNSKFCHRRDSPSSPSPSPPLASPSTLFGPSTLERCKMTEMSADARLKLPPLDEFELASVRKENRGSAPLNHSLRSSSSSISSTSSIPSEHQVTAANLLSDRQQLNSLLVTNPDDPSSLERAARMYRNAAALYDANCIWSGQLPPRNIKNPIFSCKIFLGGLPWDVSEGNLTQAFKKFGSIKIEWPGKDNYSSPPKGYVYVIFEHEKHVKALLSECTHDNTNGGSWFYKISSRRIKSKEVQIIPWVIADSVYVRCPSQRIEPKNTVFVGALHGMLNAEGLAHIFNDLFGGVVYAGIDTEKHKYPIGSGRVTFSNSKSYTEAVAAAFIEIKTQKFSKKVQVDPYLEDALCSSCYIKQGPYFCRDLACFKYFCRYCWEVQHRMEFLQHHNPLMRNTRPSGGPITRPMISLTPSRRTCQAHDTN